MSSLQVSGILVEVGLLQEVSPKFKKRDLIVDTGGEYPQVIRFEAQNEMCDALEGVEVGKYITVSFSLRGQRWKDTVINTLKAYKIDGLVKSQVAPIEAVAVDESIDKLPF